MKELLSRLANEGRLSERHASLVRNWLPVAGAVLFLILWVLAEAGRYASALGDLYFVAWAVLIGLAGVAPYASLIGAVALPMMLPLVGYVLLGSDWPDRISLADSWPAWLAVPIVVGYLAAVSRRRRLHIAALVAGFVSACAFAVVLVRSGWYAWAMGGAGDDVRAAIDLAAVLCIAVVAAWLIGIGLAAIGREYVVVGRLETTAAQLDETDLELRLAHDRGRISRDIHDSLAHSLAIIVAQAEGAAAIHELKPEAAPESLGNIAVVARHALGEVRRLVERINDEDDLSEHTSRLEHIPALIDEVRSTGVDARLRVLGAPGAVALSKQVAIYRIVQESLTNALKHGGRGGAATVTLDAQGTGLAILVVSKSGDGSPLVQGGGRGIGIVGMKERARLVGGWLTAVPSDDATFVVTAFIPPDAQAVDDELLSGNALWSEASDDVIDAASETAPLEVEGAHD